MELGGDAPGVRKARLWYGLAFAFSIFLTWWILPDLDPVQSDVAAHWYRVFSNNDEAAHAGDSAWMTILGRSLSSTMVLPPEAVLGFFGLGAMVLLLFGTFLLFGQRPGMHRFALFSVFCMALLNQPLWDEVDFGTGSAMTVLLGFVALATALTGHYRVMGVAFAALLVDSPVYLSFLVILPWLVASGATKGIRFLDLLGDFMRWGLAPMAVFALLSFLLGDDYHVITVQAMENGPREISDFLQNSMMGRLAAQPVYATGLLLCLLILSARLIQRILKYPQASFSLLPSMVFCVLVFQEQLFPLSLGESVFVGAMLLWIQFLLAFASLVKRIGSMVMLAVLFGIILLSMHFTGLLDPKRPLDAAVRKRIAVEQLDAARYLEKVPSPLSLVMVIDGLPATFRSYNAMVIPADFPVERVLKDIARYKPAMIALPGYLGYCNGIPPLGYAETSIFREANVIGGASLRIWERVKADSSARIYQAAARDSMLGLSPSILPGLEVTEITDEALVFHLPKISRGLRFGLLHARKADIRMVIERLGAAQALEPLEYPMSSEGLPGGRQVHSLQIEMPVSDTPREIRLSLKGGGIFRVFDPEFIY